MLLLGVLPASARLHQIICAILGILSVAALGLVANWGKSSMLPGPLLNYFWPTGVGLFPLVPWAAFPLLGVWLGPSIFSAPKTSEQCARAVAAGIAFLVGARFAPSHGWDDASL